LADDLWGQGGRDTLRGGRGADTLRGGAGDDVFDYDDVLDSTSGNIDRILDFGAGDKIDLSGIDAITGGADNPFSFIGSSAFAGEGTAGQLRATSSGGVWTIEGDVNGDGGADFILSVTTTHLIGASDFIL
jgi:serralysin